MDVKVAELIKKFELQIFSGYAGLENEISGGYVSDLLSDVMGCAREKQVWITLQTHRNVLAIASLKDLAAVILVKGLQPDEDSLKHSEEEGIPLLGTKMETFEIAGKIYTELNA